MFSAARERWGAAQIPDRIVMYTGFAALASAVAFLSSLNPIFFVACTAHAVSLLLLSRARAEGFAPKLQRASILSFALAALLLWIVLGLNPLGVPAILLTFLYVCFLGFILWTMPSSQEELNTPTQTTGTETVC